MDLVRRSVEQPERARPVRVQALPVACWRRVISAPPAFTGHAAHATRRREPHGATAILDKLPDGRRVSCVGSILDNGDPGKATGPLVQPCDREPAA